MLAYKGQHFDKCIKVTLEGDHLPQNHLRIYSSSVDQQYYKPEDNMIIEGSIINEGLSNVESFDITYKLNDDDVITEYIIVYLFTTEIKG